MVKGWLFGKGLVGIYQWNPTKDASQYVMKFQRMMVKGKARPTFAEAPGGFATSSNAQSFFFETPSPNDIVVALDGGYTDNFAASFTHVLVNVGIRLMTYFAHSTNKDKKKLNQMVKKVTEDYINVMSDVSNYNEVFNFVINGVSVNQKPKRTTPVDSLTDCSITDFFDVKSVSVKTDTAPKCIQEYIANTLKFIDKDGNEVEVAVPKKQGVVGKVLSSIPKPKLPFGKKKQAPSEEATTPANYADLFISAQNDFDGRVMTRVFTYARSRINKHLGQQAGKSFLRDRERYPLFLNYRLINHWKANKAAIKTALQNVAKDRGNTVNYGQAVQKLDNEKGLYANEKLNEQLAILDKSLGLFRNEKFLVAAFADILKRGIVTETTVECSPKPDGAKENGFPEDLRTQMLVGGFGVQSGSGSKDEAMKQIVTLINPSGQSGKAKLEVL